MDWSTRKHQTQFGVIVERGPLAGLADHATEFTMRHLAVRKGDRVAEPGCGTGVLSIYCAKAGAATVVGTDIDIDALAAARENAIRNGVAGVEFREGSLLEPVPGPLDLIVALLPHKPAPRAFNPRYFGGRDGTDLILAVIKQSANLLRPAGRLILYLNSIANPRRVEAEFSRAHSVRLLAEKKRPFTREEFDALTPGMFAHLQAQRAAGEAEFIGEGGKDTEAFFMARIYEGIRR